MKLDRTFYEERIESIKRALEDSDKLTFEYIWDLERMLEFYEKKN